MEGKYKQTIIPNKEELKSVMAGRLVTGDERRCFRPFPRGVVLVLLWTMLISAAHWFMYFSLLLALPVEYQFTFSISYHGLWLLVPLTGWLGDAYLGRYQAISFGLVLSQIAVLMWLVAFILLQFSWAPVPLAFTILCIGLLIGTVGFGSFYANLLPFTLDQMIGATGEELSAAAHWYYWTMYVGLFIVDAPYCVPVWNTPFQYILSDILYPIIGTSLLYCSLSVGLSVPQVA